MKVHDKYIYLDVSTFDNLILKGEILIRLFEAILKDYILIFQRPLIIQVIKTNGREKIMPFDQKNWDSTKKLLVKGEVRHLMISNYDQSIENITFSTSPILLRVSCGYELEHTDFGSKRRIADNLAFSISERLFPGKTPSDIQDSWVKLFKNIFKTIKGSVGYLTLDYPKALVIPQPSPLELLLGLNFINNSHNYNRIVQGYFWGNMISEGHIESLRGIHSLKETSPCHLVEEFEFDDRKAIYLQLTDDINEFSDNQLRSLKKSLLPILPVENKSLIEENDPFGISRKMARLVFD